MLCDHKILHRFGLTGSWLRHVAAATPEPIDLLVLLILHSSFVCLLSLLRRSCAGSCKTLGHTLMAFQHDVASLDAQQCVLVVTFLTPLISVAGSASALHLLLGETWRPKQSRHSLKAFTAPLPAPISPTRILWRSITRAISTNII